MRTTAAFLFACVLFTGCNSTKPLKVYILAGQSNMTGMVKASTLEHLKMFPDTAKEFEEMFDGDGKPVVLDDVYVSCWPKNGVEAMGKLAPVYGGGKSGDMFGPEYAFGVYMHKKLQEPILIIKTAQGGKDINFNFRPPSAGKWYPPKGHPDLEKEKEPIKLPLPKRIDLPADYVPPEDIVPIRPGRIGKFMGLRPMRGVSIGKVNGIYPIYITASPQQKFPGDPFLKGDLIIGLEGSGVREDAIQHWRDEFWGSRSDSGDWKINVTRWRKGKIDTFDFDICQVLEGGRKSLPDYLAEQEKARIENEKINKGIYYRDMIKHTKNVLSDIKRVYPNYNPDAGYEIAGFVWFQGWNDMVNGGVYPNRDKPRGYEQYSWLLEHFIRDVRKELNAPDMPFVIGVMGVGGIQDPPSSNLGYFQKAMAAPADNPEFKENVVAVHTGKYWDHDLDELATRSHKVRNKMNDFKYKDKLEGEALKKAYTEYRTKHITPEEEEILKKGVSNQGFHYLGSGKIMSGIGKGFAEAMIELNEKNKK